MDNTQIPPVQPMQPMASGSSMPPVSGAHNMTGMGPSGPMQSAPMGPNGPMQPTSMGPAPTGPTPMGPNGMPMVQQVQLAPPEKKDIAGLIKTIAIVILALIAVTFIGLFIWMTVERNDTIENHDMDVANAVAEAKDEEAMKQAKQCAEDKKYPYLTFTGPVDYGQLSFEYPKTWSVYVQQAATNGGDFAAYFNPVQVNEVGDRTINALRVSIRMQSFDDVVKSYQGFVDHPDAPMTMTSIEIGDAEKGIHQTANRYDGQLPGTELQGSIVIFKIRDKTVILQTDSEIFIPEFDKLLGTITFNA